MKKTLTRFALLLTSIACSPASAIEVNPQQMLNAHNQVRAEVGVPKLVYSAELAQSAQAWAEHLQQSNHCNMRHSKGKFGENLFWGSAWSDGRAQEIPASRVVQSWADEKSDYSYADNRCASGKVCGHYTQLVWKGSTKVGCGAALCAENQNQVWVCQYDPPGNWVGQKPY